MNILIIDDEPGLRSGLKKNLTFEGYKVFEADNTRQALEIICTVQIHIILLDLKLGGENGLDLLTTLKKEEPLVSVIIITGFGNVKSAVECMKAGAINYITKPVDLNLLLSIIRNETETHQMKKENIGLKASFQGITKETVVKSHHPKLIEVDKIVEKIKDSPASVLILGETGTGKELIARKILFSGIYRDRPFIGLNCAALNDNLLESELFGHEKGAFTGAFTRKLGRFELAGNGTLFLDEIGDMSLAMQSKLLRSLEEKTFERVGGTQSIEMYCRIITATNKDLNVLIKQGKFREDLYYRLGLVTIQLPPLRERLCDIPLLVEYLIKEANETYNKNIKGVADTVLNQIASFPWPGNIRQLKNVITNAVILSDEEKITSLNMYGIVTQTDKFSAADKFCKARQSLKTIVASHIMQVEKSVIEKSMIKHRKNISQVARALGIARKTLYEKIKQYKIRMV